MEKTEYGKIYKVSGPCKFNITLILNLISGCSRKYDWSKNV
jgi:hypothetical protein